MPPRLEMPMLSVRPEKIRRIDTRNVENLFGMWNVFSKCADSMDDGRRLENMSWRVWNREVLCCEPQPQLATTPAIDVKKSMPVSSDMPSLSSSVDSVTSEDSATKKRARNHTTSTPFSTQAISRGKEKHLTSLGLEKMVYTIQEQQDVKEPLSASIANAIPAVLSPTNVTLQPRRTSVQTSLRSSHSSASTEPQSSPDSDRSGAGTGGSDTSEDLLSSHSVVRGFSLEAPSSYKSGSHLAAPPSTGVPFYSKTKSSKPAGVKFSLGCGSSSPEGSSLDESMRRQSSLTHGLKSSFGSKKHTSFRDELHSRAMSQKSHQDENVFESSDEEEAESVVEEETEDEEEDDGSDWEDDGSDGEAVDHKHLFKRVDSQPQLVSRRSLLADMVKTESERAAEYQRLACESSSKARRSTKTNSGQPSPGNSPVEDSEYTLPSGMTKSRPIIMTTSNTHPPALSPRTTRRNMLASEMTESLRKHLLWERQQISTTAKAVLKRRHTAYDVTNLNDYPVREGQTSKNNSWNHFFDQGGEYNQAGW